MESDSSNSERQGAFEGRSQMALPEGTLLREQYRIGEVLGAGSFGITYRARDEHLDTTVAIKEYYPRQIAGRTDESRQIEPYSSGDADDFEFGRQRFLEEGRILARFEHDNIVRVRSYFEANGTGYLVMDYYEGKTLEEVLAEEGGVLEEEEAVGAIQSVLDGLESVHEEGLLHRDIDPQNIYRRSNGQIILLDFGAARVAMGERSKSLSVILKPGFAPYEQYHSEGDQGPWTDIYACSATIYKCLTGLKPPEAVARIKKDELVPPHEVRSSVSLEVSLAVMKGLALNPEQRPTTVQEFSSLLGGTLTAEEGGTNDQTMIATRRPPDASFDPALDESAVTEIREETEEEYYDFGNLLPDRTSIRFLIGGLLIAVSFAIVAIWDVPAGLSGFTSSGSEAKNGVEGSVEWNQEFQVAVGAAAIPSAFLDTLLNKAQRDSIAFYRSPREERAFASISEVKDSLSRELEESSLGSKAATTAGSISSIPLRVATSRVFLEYEYSSNGEDLIETIRSVWLLRGREEKKADLPILYFDRERLPLKEIVQSWGKARESSQASELRKGLSLGRILVKGAFSRLSWESPEEVNVVKVGGQAVFSKGKTEPIQRLETLLEQALYESDRQYILK